VRTRRTPTADQLAIRSGDRVIVIRDDGAPFITSTRSDPWEMHPGGPWLVKVEGIAGGFDLTRVYAPPLMPAFGAPVDDGMTGYQRAQDAAIRLNREERERFAAWFAEWHHLTKVEAAVGKAGQPA
jgi:hypothetical protein